jgi:2,4-dienoyl-CoA reductase-like NADH-dependent reductase (Old Yellow Enzyme family)
MKDDQALLFTPGRIGDLTIRNRTIRAAAYEGMCPGNRPSEKLIDYHRAVASGGIGMTTVAYAAVARSGLSFDRQLWIRPETIADLRKLTDAVHREGAAVSIQLGHCGNMASPSIAGCRPLAPTARINPYGPTWPRAMHTDDIKAVALEFGRAVSLAGEAGFDAVEIHAGHGYLISQFLSPYTNRRRDEWGGSLENRARFLRLVMREVRREAVNQIAVLVKMNLRDGFRGGAQLDESVEVAKMLEQEGADALVLSGGFVSKSPMYIMRGKMPIRTMVHNLKNPWLKIGISLVGPAMIRSYPFEEAYFLEDALIVRDTVKVPLVFVGGLISRAKIDEVLSKGFEFIAMARSLIVEPDFVNRLKREPNAISKCQHSNHCVAAIYSGEMACWQNCSPPSPSPARS